VTSIENYLKDNGPTLSSVLISELKSENLSDEAIRKRISRLKPPITKMSGFFQDNQSLFYLQEQYLKPEFFEGLLNSIKTDAKHYNSILETIKFHHGYLEKNQIASFVSSPVKNLIGHKNVASIIEGLISLELIKLEGDYYKLTVYSDGDVNDNFRYHKGVELAKETILSQFYSWARNIGLVSYDSGSFHTEFSKFQWGFVAPSYVTGILKSESNKKTIPAFVVADVLIGNAVRIKDVEFFIKKVEITKILKISNFLPFLIVSGVSEDALKLLKSKGIIVAFIDRMFGSEYEELLKSLITTVTNAGAILKNNPEVYINLIFQLNKLVDGKTNNLRGDLFELAVGYYHSNKCQSLDVGKKVIFDGQSAEIDVFAIYHNEIRIAECKGVKYKIGQDYTDRWLGNRLPLFYNWIKNIPEYRDRNIVFEFWATSGFEDDALLLLNERAAKTKKYQIEFYGQEQITAKVEESKSQKLIEIIREYFGENI
jgi:hypothetical protein